MFTYSFLGQPVSKSSLPTTFHLGISINSCYKIKQYNYTEPINFPITTWRARFSSPATDMSRAYDPKLDPDLYRYRKFGYFLLLDEDWEKMRVETRFDVVR